MIKIVLTRAFYNRSVVQKLPLYSVLVYDLKCVCSDKCQTMLWLCIRNHDLPPLSFRPHTKGGQGSWIMPLTPERYFHCK